jgi:hypothetical protein
VCRSIAEGGRRCPGGMAPAPARQTAAAAAPRAERRAEARRRWDEAERGLGAAQEALGPAAKGLSHLLTGPLSEQARLASGGGDPAVYDGQVEQGRALLIATLRGHGNDDAAAAAKADALAQAYTAWLATPEGPAR